VKEVKQKTAAYKYPIAFFPKGIIFRNEAL